MICRTLLIIGLISCIAGVFEVNVTHTFYQAEENHNITLEWTFTSKPHSPISISCYQLTENRTFDLYHDLLTEPKGPVLYCLHGGVESQDDQFAGRVQCNRDALRTGQIELELSRLRTNDSGRYMCNVNTDYGHGSASCRLNVTAADRPQPPSPNPDTARWTSIALIAAVLLSVCLSVLWFVVQRQQKWSSLTLRISASQTNRTYGTQSGQTGLSQQVELHTLMGPQQASVHHHLELRGVQGSDHLQVSDLQTVRTAVSLKKASLL